MSEMHGEEVPAGIVDAAGMGAKTANDADKTGSVGGDWKRMTSKVADARPGILAVGRSRGKSNDGQANERSGWTNATKEMDVVPDQ